MSDGSWGAGNSKFNREVNAIGRRWEKERARAEREGRAAFDRENRGHGDQSEWNEKECAECTNTIRYHDDWNNVPDLCDDCREAAAAKWHEKPCGNSGCSNTIRYNEDWEHVPNYCKECKAAGRRLYDRSKGDGHGGIYKTSMDFNGQDNHPEGKGYKGPRQHMNRRDGTHFAVNGDGSNPHEGKTRKRHQ